MRFLIIVTASVVMALAAYRVLPNPSSPEIIDLGRVTAGEQHRFEWNIRNSGLFPLSISKIEASCGCTSLIGGDKHITIKGGESMSIPFSIYVGENPSLSDVRLVALTNSPTAPQIVSQVRAHPVSLIRCTPQQLIVLPEDRLADETAFVREVRFTVIPEDLELKSLAPHVDEAFVECTVAGSGPKTALIQIRIKKPLPSGELSIPIRLDYELSDGLKAHSTFTIKGSFGGVEKASPAIIRLSPKHPNTRFQTNLVSPASPKIVQVRGALPLKVSPDQQEAVAAFNVERLDSTNGQQPGAIYIYSSEGDSVLSIPVFLN